MFDNTRAIFTQLGDFCSGPAVKTLIENHDAWTHNELVESLATARLHLQPRDAATQARIARQRQALAPLVVRLPAAYAAAV